MRDGSFDVILMDHQMPELDGLEATRQIRAFGNRKSRTPIIVMTAHAMAGAREEYLAAGMDDYISKPYQAATLLEKLAAIPASGFDEGRSSDCETALARPIHRIYLGCSLAA